MNGQLLRTKLYAPPSHPHLVPRPHLVERLEEGVGQGRRLTLLSAPAGSGKTTLLGAWATSRPVAWLSLDAEDNDPARFWRYVVAALETVLPEGALDPPPPPSSTAPQPFLTALINDLAALKGTTVLVLDDYHLITHEGIHGGVSFLLEHLPPSLHLVIATRVDPPLPVVRLRAHHLLTEVRARDLRFSSKEAALFLNESMGLELAPEDVEALEVRTEGWVVGLQLAALALQSGDLEGREEAHAFVADFSRGHHYVLDYLVEEVLGRQPPEVQDFLLKSSILERLSGPLCDAVVGGAEGRSGDSQTMLERLDRANLFLVPLDARRRWYRYHHLFAELLRGRLSRQHPELVPALHERAARWFEEHGFAAEAIANALAAEDFERAERLVAAHWRQTAHNGAIATSLRWLEALPTSLVRDDPVMSMAYAWALFLNGQVDAMQERLEDARQSMARLEASGEEHDDPVEYATLPAQLASLSSVLARRNGDFEGARELAHRALELTPDYAVLLKGVASLGLAHAYRLSGDLERAVETYQRAIPMLREGENVVAITTATLYLVKVLQQQGRLHLAMKSCRDALRTAEGEGVAQLPAYAIVHLAMADVLREWNRLDEAEEHLEEALRLGERMGYVEGLIHGGIARAQLLRARGDLEGALTTLRETMGVHQKPDASLAAFGAAALLARLSLLAGDLAEGAHWGEVATLADEPGRPSPVTVAVTARLHVARGETEEAVAALTRAFAAAESAGLRGNAVELLWVKALAFFAAGNEDLALVNLERALDLAEPEGYVRTFLDEGEAGLALLRRAHDAGIAPRYVGRLLEAAGVEEAPAGAKAPPSLREPSLRRQRLVDPLSDREVEVLGLMAEGLSNREIAERLFVTVGTVKSHAHHIYVKLDASNRAQAVAIAGELGLL